MNAVILAAGTGSRLVSSTRYLPKALVSVADKPLIDYTISFARSLNCPKISIVGGFYFDKLQQHLAVHAPEAHLFENTEFLKGNALSLLCALEAQDDGFLLLNVDHIYPLRLGQAFLKLQPQLKPITAFVDFDRPLGDDDMKVFLSSDRKIQKISKNLHDFHAGYIGMTYVPRHQLQAYKDVAYALTAQNSDAVVEHILQKFVDQQQPPGIFDASGIRWLEVDNQTDLRNAERILQQVPDYLA